MRAVYNPTWCLITIKQFIEALNYLITSLESRLLINFKDTDISYEAEAIADGAWEHYMSMPASGDKDPSAFADLANDAGVTHYMMLFGIRQGILNIFAAGLYHSYEQQLLYFTKVNLVPNREIGIDDAKQLLANSSVDITAFKTWPIIDELRLVANSTKHAEGSSAKQLRIRRPDLFEDPWLKRQGLEELMQMDRPLYLPIMGEGLFVSLNDLHRYRDALIQFWDEFARLIEP